MAIELRTVVDVLRRVSPLPDGALLVGAWVPSFYGSDEVLLTASVATRDVDFALSTTPGNRMRHREWLDSLPVRLGSTRYELRYRGTSFGATPFTVLAPIDDVGSLPDIEVITELRGGGRREPNLRSWFPGDFVPQEVRQLEVPFAGPRTIELPGGGASVAVPNPLAYVSHKALIRRRDPEKEIKDATDILEAAIRTVGSGRLEGLRPEIEAHSKRAIRQMNGGLACLRRDLLSPGSTLLSQAARALPLPITDRQAIDVLRRFLAECGVER